MSITAAYAPLAAQALQRVGYHIFEDTPIVTKPTESLHCANYSETSTTLVFS